jgi:carboxyl-terminal processing protease
VQIPNIEVPYNGNLKLTTAKYYIPSGRCIQAINYKHSGGGYKEHVPDSLTRVFYTRNGREVRDGGGIKPDIEVKPDTMANITLYLDRLDSTEVLLDYVVDYIGKHPAIASAKDFHLTDADYEDFKQRVVKAGFTYDQVSKKQYDELVKVAKFEGYYEDALAEFEALKAKLDHHDIARDMDRHREEIQHMIEQDIISAYYFQAGRLEAALEYDKAVKEAERILNAPEEYERILSAPK